MTNLGPRLCNLLPALHSLSGCDSTSSLFSIGKRKAFQSLRSNIAALEDLINYGSHPADIEQDCYKSAKLLALFYGERLSDLNTLWYKLFAKKNVDSCKLPPTEDAAAHHIKSSSLTFGNQQDVQYSTCFLQLEKDG